MATDDLVRFAQRDWAAVREAKTQHWLRRKQAMSPADLWALSHDPWRHARSVKPNGPPLADRLADLAVHQRVGQALRVVARPTR